MSAGTAFEKSVKLTCEAYHSAGIASFEKTDPPTKTLRPGGRPPVVVNLKNPFLDFVGTWTALDGKAIFFECKYTSEPILSIGNDSGIKAHQLANAIRWQGMGAAVFFLWRWQSETRLVTPRMVQAQLTTRKSLRWMDAHPVPQGKGFIILDFLALMRGLQKPKP